MTTALILSGGGARAAYQVGVLKALAELLPHDTYNPFPIICGTSAGAINTMALAGRPGHFRLRVRKLETIWRDLTAEQIYRTDTWGVLKNSISLALSFLHSGYGVNAPVAFLDNSPLRELITHYIRFRHVDEALASGELQAVSITAMAYDTGQSITFFQGNHDNWQRSRRIGIRSGLTIDHLMASSAIPTIFPAIKIGNCYYGDGAMRQLKPLSPALHLGANRIFVVGVSDNPIHLTQRVQPSHSPSVAHMLSHLLNSAFIDTIESDLETLESINRLVRHMSTDEKIAQGVADLQHIEALSVSPSVAINEIAEEHIHELPASVRVFLRVTGANARGGGSSAASYLLFEPGFCRKLLELGYQDALAQEEQIRQFFSTPDAAVITKNEPEPLYSVVDSGKQQVAENQQ